MRGVLTFSEFAQAVENRLWLLGVESEFTLDDLGARWTCVPYTVAVEAVDAARARALICVDRKLRHAFAPARMTAGGAETLARAVGILFGGNRVAARCEALDLFCRVRASAGTAVDRRSWEAVREVGYAGGTSLRSASSGRPT